MLFFFFLPSVGSVSNQYLNCLGVKCVLRGFLVILGKYLL